MSAHPSLYSFLDVNVAGNTGTWSELARVSSGPLISSSWRITVHEPRGFKKNGSGGFDPQYLPSAPAAAGLVGRVVDQDAGLLLRVEWQRMQVMHEAIVDYCQGGSFTVQGSDVRVLARCAEDPAQVLPAGGAAVSIGCTIEDAKQGSMSSWPPTRSKDTGVIAKIAAGVHDNVYIPIPPYARAFRWHGYQVAAAPTTISFRQVDKAGSTVVRSVVAGTTDAASWPRATGAVPVMGTCRFLNVQNDDAAQDVALWIEFLLDLGG